MTAPLSWRITRANHPEGGRVWAVYDIATYDRSGGSRHLGPYATDASVVFTAATEAECQSFIDMHGTTEDLARVLSEGSGSLSIAAIAQERARIREAMNKTKGER